MTKRSIPEYKPPPEGWFEGELTTHIDNMRSNQYATFANTNINSLLNVDRVFRLVAEHNVDPDPLFPMLFMYRSHSAFLAASSLAMAGHTYETYPVVRGCLEIAGYGFFIGGKNDRYERWLRRHDSIEAKSTVLREFSYKKIRKSLNKADPTVARYYHAQYEQSIDFGGHPNERAFSSNLQIIKEKDQTKLNAIYLHSDPLFLAAAMNATRMAGIIALMVFQLVYPKMFDAVGASEELEKFELLQM